jgi:hypothetical protein
MVYTGTVSHDEMLNAKKTIRPMSPDYTVLKSINNVVKSGCTIAISDCFCSFRSPAGPTGALFPVAGPVTRSLAGPLSATS